MQVRPSNSLLHALSRFADGATTVRQPAAPAAPAQPAAPAATRGVPADAARAAARAAFQALRAPAPTPQPAMPAVVQPGASAVAAQTAAPPKILPRGSFLNILV